MDSVLVIAPRAYDFDWRRKIPGELHVTDGASDTMVISDGITRMYLSRDKTLDDFDTNELHLVKVRIPDPIVYYLEFSDMHLCRIILGHIADDANLLVDNDHGLLLSGSDFVRLLRERPDWDWRRGSMDKTNRTGK